MGTQKHVHLFQPLEDPQLSLGTFLFSLSVQMKLLEKLVGNKHLSIRGLCVAIDKPEKATQ